MFLRLVERFYNECCQPVQAEGDVNELFALYMYGCIYVPMSILGKIACNKMNAIVWHRVSDLHMCIKQWI